MLRCDKEKPVIDSYLVSEEDRQWKIKANAVIGPGTREQQLFKTLEKENSFLFELQPLEHNVLPAVGSRLRVSSTSL